jgi:hypothetical protein
MTKKQGALSGFALVLPLVALLVFVSLPTPVCAELACATCEYGGNDYDQNACIDTCGSPTNRQVCKENGSWSNCKACGGHECVETEGQ